MARQDIEIDEALTAVEDALNCLDAAARDLKSAGNWGWFDIFGGGFFSSLIKHDKMQAAQRHLSAAQASLARLAVRQRLHGRHGPAAHHGVEGAR